MAIELFCEVHGCELDTYVLNKKVTVTPCSMCESDVINTAYSEGCDSRDDEVESLQEQLDDQKDKVASLQKQLTEATTERYPINGPNS